MTAFIGHVFNLLVFVFAGMLTGLIFSLKMVAPGATWP